MESQSTQLSTESVNEANEDHPEVQRIWDVTKIGHFDVDSWTTILSYLKETELANVALVCKDFQLMAESIFEKRWYNQHNDFRIRPVGVSFSNIIWKPIICRFRNFISHVMVVGPPPGVAVRQEDFAYFQHFLGDTVKSICFDGVDTRQWKGVVYQRRFDKVEDLTFMRSDLRRQSPLLHHFSHWYPNLKSLSFSQVGIGMTGWYPFIEQSVPSLSNLSFDQVDSVNTDYLLVSVIKNPQLKRLSADLNLFPLEVNMSCMPIVNEVLTNLESLQWFCVDLSFLPTFRQNFEHLKELTFAFMSNESSYKNELMKIIGYFPVLEKLRLTLISKLLITNDDLIDLLTHGSSALKEIDFSSKSSCTDLELKFGYDLHRRVCQASANRSNVDIIIELNFAGLKYHITKDCIKKNGQLIVVKDSIDD